MNAQVAGTDLAAAPKKVSLVSRVAAKYEIDASYDLWAAGFKNNEEQVESFGRAFSAAARRIAKEMRIEISVVRAAIGSTDAAGCDDSEESCAIWQAIHDEVCWDGPREFAS